jgi:hypothetical protein
MAVRYYCDGCGAEVTEKNECAGGPIYVKSRFGGEIVAKSGVKLKVEIITSLDGVANAGCFCRHCVVQAINDLAKPAPKEPRLRALR